VSHWLVKFRHARHHPDRRTEHEHESPPGSPVLEIGQEVVRAVVRLNTATLSARLRTRSVACTASRGRRPWPPAARPGTDVGRSREEERFTRMIEATSGMVAATNAGASGRCPPTIAMAAVITRTPIGPVQPRTPNATRRSPARRRTSSAG